MPTILKARYRLDAASALAMICIFMGWFVLDTLRVTVGPLIHRVRFYDMAAIISNPVQVFAGIDGAHAYYAVPFGLLCLAAILGPLLPRIWRNRTAWLASLTPLSLIMFCALLLVVRASGDFLSTTNDQGVVASGVLRLANGLLRRGGDIATRRLSIAAGAYLALIGSAFLAVRGVQRYRSGGAGHA